MNKVQEIAGQIFNKVSSRVQKEGDEIFIKIDGFALRNDKYFYIGPDISDVVKEAKKALAEMKKDLRFFESEMKKQKLEYGSTYVSKHQNLYAKGDIVNLVTFGYIDRKGLGGYDDENDEKVKDIAKDRGYKISKL